MFRYKTIGGLLLLTALLVASGCQSDKSLSPSPSPATDTIWLSSDTVSPGDTAEILVNIGNPDSVVAGMNLWLKPEVTSITYDTIAPVSPRFPASGMEWGVFDHTAENIVAILFVDYEFKVFLPPGSGPVMKIRYAVDSTTPAGTYAINSEALAGVPRSYDLSYQSGTTLPDVLFLPGTIVVQ